MEGNNPYNLQNTTCINLCIDTFYPNYTIYKDGYNSSICKSCILPCNTCLFGNIYSCLSCFDGYFLNSTNLVNSLTIG